MRLLPLALIVAGLFAWAVGLHGFVQSLPARPDLGPGVEAVIVLTGGQGRLQAGFRLLEDHPGARLLVSGVGAGVRAEDLVVPDAVQARVDLGRTAVDTVGNAVESRRWARERGVRRAVLVTNTLHLPRSLLLFRHLAPELEVVPYPVAAAQAAAGERPLTWYALAATEYTKSLVMRVIVVLGGLDDVAGAA